MVEPKKSLLICLVALSAIFAAQSLRARPQTRDMRTESSLPKIEPFPADGTYVDIPPRFEPAYKSDSLSF